MRRPVCLCALLFAAAVWAALLLWPAGERIAEKAEGRIVTVCGTVEWKEYARSSSYDSLTLQLTLSNVTIESGIPAEIGFTVRKDDQILCMISDTPMTQENWATEGAQVRIRGKLRLYRRASNDGEFDAFLYYGQIRGLLFSLRDAQILAYTQNGNPFKAGLYAVRKNLSSAIDSIYQIRLDERPLQTDHYASAMKAMLLGQTGLMDPELKEQYQTAGIIHVLCISGVHLSLLGTGLFRLLLMAGVPIPVSSAASAGFLLLYGLMTGMHTSCFRALIMFTFQAAAKALGRTYDSLTALAVAAVLLLTEQPAYLYYNGFLFSFAAVIAIGLVSPAFPKKAAPLMIPICTLPVQLSFYYTFPLYSIVLNLIVIAAAPVLIAGGVISLFPHLLAQLLPGCLSGLAGALAGLSRLIALVAEAILFFFDWLCAAAQKLPFHTLIAGKPDLRLVILYFCLIALAWAIGLSKIGTTRRAAVLQAAMITSAVLLLFTIRYKPPLSLYMWNVGQGDGLCLMTHDESGDSCILIDGGSSSRQGIGEHIEIPFLKYHGIARIDCCILTHDDLDHCSGLLELLKQHGEVNGIRIDSVALPSVSEKCKGELYTQIEDLAEEKEIPVQYLHRGMALKRGAFELECIHPKPYAENEDANEYSSVLLLKYRHFSALLTGDLEGEGEEELLNYLRQERIDADVLKVAHHGSKGGTSQDFLAKVSARIALISCGKDNPYGHPSPQTLERLQKAGMKIYDTREAGQICVETDGWNGYSVHTFY